MHFLASSFLGPINAWVGQASRQAVQVPLGARTRNSVITNMVEVAARTLWLWDPPKMVEAVRGREELYPTAMDNGVALMHPADVEDNLAARRIQTQTKVLARIAKGAVLLNEALAAQLGVRPLAMDRCVALRLAWREEHARALGAQLVAAVVEERDVAGEVERLGRLRAGGGAGFGRVILD